MLENEDLVIGQRRQLIWLVRYAHVMNTVETTHRRVIYNHSSTNQVTNRLGIIENCYNRSAGDKSCQTDYYHDKPVNNRNY